MFARSASYLAIAGLVMWIGGCRDASIPSGLHTATLETRSAKPDESRRPRVVRFPAAEFATLQHAVDAVADGGTVFIGPGAHKVNADIVGKSVRFLGERQATTLVAGDGTRSILRFGAGGGGEVRDLNFHGGTSAIEGVGKFGPLAPLALRNVFATTAIDGITGQFGELEIRDSRFEKLSHSGIDIRQVVRLLLSGVFVADASCYGLFVFNTNPNATSLTVQQSFFNNNGCGGVGIWGGAAPIVIDGAFAHDNGVGGMIFVETGQSTLTSLFISGTLPDANGLWGDGVIFWGGTSVLSRATIHSNARAGLSVNYCVDAGLLADVTIGRTTFHSNRYDLAATRTSEGCGAIVNPLHDAGRNRCLDDPREICTNSSVEISPLPPPP